VQVGFAWPGGVEVLVHAGSLPLAVGPRSREACGGCPTESGSALWLPEPDGLAAFAAGHPPAGFITA
jgi:hypothetical protein